MNKEYLYWIDELNHSWELNQMQLSGSMNQPSFRPKTQHADDDWLYIAIRLPVRLLHVYYLCILTNLYNLLHPENLYLLMNNWVNKKYIYIELMNSFIVGN